MPVKTARPLLPNDDETRKAALTSQDTQRQIFGHVRRIETFYPGTFAPSSNSLSRKRPSAERHSYRSSQTAADSSNCSPQRWRPETWSDSAASRSASISLPWMG